MDDEDDEDVYRPAPRKAKNLGKRASLPTFESSMDKFITEAKAEPHGHDVSYFDKDSRETGLAKEVDDLKAQLAKALARADAAVDDAGKARKEADAAKTAGSIAAEPPPPTPEPKRGWGGILAGFAVGALCMFGVTRLMAKPEVPAAAQQAQTTQQPEPKPAAIDKPVEPVAQPVDKPIDKPVEPVVEPKPPEPKPADNLAAKTPVKRPPIAQRPAKPADPKPADPKPADPKPADPKPADPGLYNPF